MNRVEQPLQIKFKGLRSCQGHGPFPLPRPPGEPWSLTLPCALGCHTGDLCG